MLDKGGASFLGSIGFDGGDAGRFGGCAAGRGAGGISSWLRLLNKLIRAALPADMRTKAKFYVLLVYRGFQKKGKLSLEY
jgi:hypothetical protein